MNITIKTIKHSEQRYETCGDWLFDSNGDLNVFVSDTGNETYNWLIAEHEINEALICKRDGISEKSVSDFDIAFERVREEYYEIIGEQEPGDMVKAPYFDAHQKATQLEKLSAVIHKVDWSIYNNVVESL